MKRVQIIAGTMLAVFIVLAVFAGSAAASISITTDSKNPYYGYGELSVNSVPNGATVYIDGSYRGNTPMYNFAMPAGTHRVTVRMDGYDTWSTDVSVYDGVSQTVSATLNPIYRTGYLSISSSPSKAAVYINNVYEGDTPLSLSLPEGTYNLELKRAGYSPYYSTVSVLADRTSFVTASLTSDVQSGYINVYATPAGAALYVDSVFIGNAPASAYLTAGPFSTGVSHTLTASSAGYQTASSTFILNPGETKQLTLSLSPEAAKQTATLYVSSSPSNAAIYLDNIYYGVTPATIPDIVPGSHVLKLSAQNYNEWQETITLTAGKTFEQSVSLAPATPTPAPTAPAKTPLPLAGILVGLGAAAVLLFRRN